MSKQRPIKYTLLETLARINENIERVVGVKSYPARTMEEYRALVDRLRERNLELLDACKIAVQIFESNLSQTDDMRPVYEAIANVTGDE